MDAEHPLDSLTAAPRTRSSQAWSIATPYFALTAAEGKLSKVHMPSSAWAAAEAASDAATHASAIEILKMVSLPCLRCTVRAARIVRAFAALGAKEVLRRNVKRPH